MPGVHDTPPSQDHPRSRGEYKDHRADWPCGRGSSPLSRGILYGRVLALYATRIIPALAGNTAHTPTAGHICQDHPRSRGEYLVHFGLLEVALGSSPLSRGIPSDQGVLFQIMGIIPALAGNTGLTGMSSSLSWDHPRSRGEYAHRAKHYYTFPGSSPLSRGILCHTIGGFPPMGIIPALAGNTRRASHSLCGPRDHPRSRGEYTSVTRTVSGKLGSSPLSRGIHARVLGVRHTARIIPALAGNTPVILRVWVTPSGSSPLSRGILCMGDALPT